MDTESPRTPDVDLPEQQQDQADLDITVEPEPEPDAVQEDGASDDAVDDPELGNTLISPENS